MNRSTLGYACFKNRLLGKINGSCLTFKHSPTILQKSNMTPCLCFMGEERAYLSDFLLTNNIYVINRTIYILFINRVTLVWISYGNFTTTYGRKIISANIHAGVRFLRYRAGFANTPTHCRYSQSASLSKFPRTAHRMWWNQWRSRRDEWDEQPGIYSPLWHIIAFVDNQSREAFPCRFRSVSPLCLSLSIISSQNTRLIPLEFRNTVCCPRKILGHRPREQQKANQNCDVSTI